MRLLCIDTDDTSLDICYRAVEAGHSVRVWTAPNKDKSKVWTGTGFPGIERVDSWQPSMSWIKKGDGLVINAFNDRKIVRALDEWRKFGVDIFGPTVKSAELEWERGKGMEFMKKYGIEVPEYHTFKNLNECLKFAWKAQEPYVFKVLGDEESKDLSYVASDPSDLVGWLEMKISRGLKLKGDCILQERVDKICDMGVSGWLGKEGFLANKWNLNWEHKKLMPGDFGPNTGEMGTICCYREESKLAEEMLKPFEKALVELGHRGDVDIECGITASGKAIPYEFSMRMGWPSTFILMASHTGDPISWMKDAMNGKDTLEVDDRVAIGVIMARPPFPTKNDDPQSNVGYPITGIEDVFDNVSPWQMMLGEGPVMEDGKITKGPVYQTTGDYICCATALGHDVHDAKEQVYATIDHIKFADRIVRNDIGARLEKELPKLKALGYDEVPDW